MKISLAVAIPAALFFSASIQAQWQQIHDINIPLTPSGEPNLTAPAPKMADGKPNLNGVWLADADLLLEEVEFVEAELPLPRHLIDIMFDFTPAEEDAPAEVVMQPWADALFEERVGGRGLDDPIAYCKPWGVTLHAVNIMPYKIVQTPDLVMILNEQDTVFRQIFLDGRQPVKDPVPRWLGYSTGRWEGNELVVETTGFTDQTWLDSSGHPHTEALHLTERFRRPDAGHLEIEFTINDPGTYSKPFSYTITATITPDSDLLEFFCTDNEISSEHYQ